MADYTDLNVYHDVGPVLETTSRVSHPVVGATNRFTTSVSRDGDPINTASVQMQILNSSNVIVYPANNTAMFSNIAVGESGEFRSGVLTGLNGSRGKNYVIGEHITIVQELGGAAVPGGSDAIIEVTGVFNAANSVVTAANATGPLALFAIVSAGLRYKSGPATTKLSATHVTVPRDLSMNGFYALVPDRTDIFENGHQYQINWIMTVPADEKFPACVYPRTQYVVASDS
jgi:hypothetical protein